MSKSEHTTVRCPKCGSDIADIFADITAESDRIVAYLADWIYPVMDGVLLPLCDECEAQG